MTPPVNEKFVWENGPTGRTLRALTLAPFARHVFTSRDVSFRGDGAEEDQARLAEVFGVDRGDLVFVSQVHGRTVLHVAGGPVATGAEADAIVSTVPGRVIVVRVADCVPILLADTRRRVVAAVHAGWRGTCAGIAQETVKAIEALGIPPTDLVAALGPSIGPCCYHVDARVRTSFLGGTSASAEASARPDAAAWFTESGEGRWLLDLWKANVDQLESAGVPAGSISLAGVCTADNLDRCFSYRAEGPGGGRMVAAIQLSIA
jgi:YfiH family protein